MVHGERRTRRQASGDCRDFCTSDRAKPLMRDANANYTGVGAFVPPREDFLQNCLFELTAGDPGRLET